MNRKRNTGQAFVEMTLLLPFLVLLTLLVADLARIFYFGMGITQAVRAGVQYGAQHPADADGMKAATVAAGADVALLETDVIPAPYRYWRCPSDPMTTENTNFPIPEGSCGTEQPLLYVRVEATKDFTTLYGGYAWIPKTVTITRVAQMQTL